MSQRASSRRAMPLEPVIPLDYCSDNDAGDDEPTSHPFANAGQQTVALLLAFAMEDRQAARQDPAKRQDIRGAPGTMRRRQAWWALYSAYVRIMNGDINEPPDGEQLSRFMRHVIKRLQSSHLDRDAPSKGYFMNGLHALTARLIFEYANFKLTPHDAAIIEADLAKLVQQGHLTIGAGRQKQWVGLQLVRKMITDWFTKALSHGTSSWDITISRALTISLEYSLDSRAGEVLRSDDYHEDQYMKWSDVNYRLVGGDSFKNVIVQITMRWEKGSKDNPSKTRLIRLRPLANPISAPMDCVVLLTIMALRTGQVAASTLNEALALANNDPCGQLQWQHPQRPLIAYIQQEGKHHLDVDRGAAINQGLSSLRQLAEAASIREVLVQHDLRRGAVRDNARVEKLDAGVDGRVAAAVGHTGATFSHGTTDMYAGRVSHCLPNQREALAEDPARLAFGIVPAQKPFEHQHGGGLIEKMRRKQQTEALIPKKRSGGALTPADTNMRIRKRDREEWAESAPLLTKKGSRRRDVAQAVRESAETGLQLIGEHLNRGPRYKGIDESMADSTLNLGLLFENAPPASPTTGHMFDPSFPPNAGAAAQPSLLAPKLTVSPVFQPTLLSDFDAASRLNTPLWHAEPSHPLSRMPVPDAADIFLPRMDDDPNDILLPFSQPCNPEEDAEGDPEEDAILTTWWTSLFDTDGLQQDNDEFSIDVLTEALAKDLMMEDTAPVEQLPITAEALIDFLARINHVRTAQHRKTPAQLLLAGYVSGNSRDDPSQFVRDCKYKSLGCPKKPFFNVRLLETHERVACWFRPDASADDIARATALSEAPSAKQPKKDNVKEKAISVCCPRKETCGSTTVFTTRSRLMAHLRVVHQLSVEEMPLDEAPDARLKNATHALPYSPAPCPIGRCRMARADLASRQKLLNHLLARPHQYPEETARAIAGAYGATRRSEALTEALGQLGPPPDPALCCPRQDCAHHYMPFAVSWSRLLHMKTVHKLSDADARSELGMSRKIMLSLKDD